MLISTPLFSREINIYKFHVNALSNKITITLIPTVHSRDFIYQPPFTGFFSEDRKAFELSSLNAYSGTKSITVKKSDNLYNITSGEKIDSIKYQITINKKSLRDGSPFLMKGTDFLIIPAIVCLLPKEEFNEIRLQITTGKKVNTTLPSTKTTDEITVGIISKEELYTPVLFTTGKEIELNIQNKNFRIIHVANTPDTLLSKMLAETLTLPDFHKDVFPDHYHFYIQTLPVNHQQFNRSTTQQSQFEKNYCIVNLPESFNRSDIKSYIYNICSEAEVSLLVNNFTLNYTAIHRSPWINEGLRPYLTLQNLCKNGIYSESDYLTMMTEKIEGSAGMPLFSLAEYQNNSFFNKQEQYKAVSNRSILFSWLLDIQIISLTSARSSLANVLSAIIANKDLTIASDEDLVQEVVRLTHPDIQQFFDEYYYHPRSFQYKRILKAGGYIYVSSEVTDLYKCGPLEIEFDDTNRKILLRKTNPCFSNESGDELTAVNNRPVGRSNIHQLFKSYFTRNYSPDEISLTVLRKGEAIYLKCTPVSRKEAVSFFIYPDMNAPKLQFISRKIITGN